MEMNEITYLVYDADGEYLGRSPLREQAVGAAKTAAKNRGGFADVVRVAVTKSGTTTRSCRYHADGTVEQLWKRPRSTSEKQRQGLWEAISQES